MRGIPAAFKEVSEKWYNTLTGAKTMNDIPGHGSDDEGKSMGQAAHCVVGEAYGWLDDYWNGKSDRQCNECGQFSAKFYNIVEGDYDGRGPRKQTMIATVKEFTAHWKKVHNPLIGTVPDLEPYPIEVQQPKAK